LRISYVLALMVAGVLAAAGIASAQSTTTEPLSDYTSTTPTVTTPKTTTTQATQTEQSAPAGAGEVGAEQQTEAVAPAVAAQPAGNAPAQLAFTGAEPILLIALGLALAGGTAFLLVRERRRS
jgi:LPXTG-motif cell wall-anchored protein